MIYLSYLRSVSWSCLPVCHQEFIAVRPTNFPVHQLVSTVLLWEPFELSSLGCSFLHVSLGRLTEGLHGMTTWQISSPSLSCSHTIFCQIWIPNLEEILCQIHSFIEWYIYLRCRIFLELYYPLQLMTIYLVWV